MAVYGAWRRARRADAAAVRAFVREREAYAAGLAGRIRAPDGGLRLPARPGGLYLSSGEGGSPQGLCYFGAGRSVLPLFERPSAVEAAGLGELAGALRFRPAACVGLAEAVDALEAACAWEPPIRQRYRAMSLDPGDYRPSGLVRGLELRRATLGDLEGLFPLACAYEREEVLSPLHRFDPAAAKATQLRALREQRVYLAAERGRIVGRAQTNARGWARDQIGGVFVLPELRGRGIGRAVVQALLSEIFSAGRGAALFVKDGNEAARSLYEGLGFGDEGPFRVDYFSG